MVKGPSSLVHPRPVRKRIALDAMAVGFIADTPGLLRDLQLLVERGAVVIVVRGDVGEQIAARHVANPARAAQLLSVCEALRAASSKASPPGAREIAGVAESRAPIRDRETRSDVPSISSALHAAPIGIAASDDANVLVTREGTLRQKLRRTAPHCRAWSPEDLRNFVSQKKHSLGRRSAHRRSAAQR
jgi:hypothetical protein